jgi:hypothetical protein
MTNLIGLSGYARTGKDTVAAALREHGYRRASFADVLREAALALDPFVHAPDERFTASRYQRLSDVIAVYGWEAAKDAYPDVRRLLQRLGTDVGREIFGQNVWVDLAMGQVFSGDRVVFTDCRFPNEADAIRERGGQVWRIERPGFGPVNGHPSETALDGYPFDQYVLNCGDVDYLRVTVVDLVGVRP